MGAENPDAYMKAASRERAGTCKMVDVDKFDVYCFLDESIFVSVLVLHLRSVKV